MFTCIWHSLFTFFLCVYTCESSLYFSGGIEYGVIPNSTLIDQIDNGDFTIQAWFSIDGESEFGQFSSILGTSTHDNNGFIFGISSTNGDATPWIKLSQNYIPDCCLYYDDGDWHHFIAVKNSSQIQFYIDGQSKYTTHNMYALYLYDCIVWFICLFLFKFALLYSMCVG